MPIQVKHTNKDSMLAPKTLRHHHSYLLDLRKKPLPSPQKVPTCHKVPSLRLSFYQKPKNIVPRPFLKHELLRLAAAACVIVLFFNIVNVYYRALDMKASVRADASAGFSRLLSAGQAAAENNSEKSRALFSEAFDAFSNAERDLSKLSFFAENFETKGELVSAAGNIVKSGKSLASAGSYFVSALDGFSNVFSRMIDQTATKPSLTDQLKEHHEKLLAATADLSFALTYLSKVNRAVLPEQMRPMLETARAHIETFQKMARILDSYFPILLTLLGDRYPERILVLLQNNNEIRPGGGFIGSFLLLDLNDGALSFSFNDVYDFDRNLHEFVAPPLEIANVTDTWRLRDSNYSPHFPISAEKAAWFLEKEQGPGVDSVFAMDLSFVGDILDVIGPIMVNGVTYDRDNFDTLLSYIIESKLDGLEDPKTILRAFIPAVKEKLFAIKNPMVFLEIFRRAVGEKHLAFYSKNADIQQFFDDFALSGAFEKKSLDFLSVIHSSIGGNKSDRYMQQSLTHKTVIEDNGQVAGQVTIKRRNTYSREIEQKILTTLKDAGFGEPSAQVMDILGRGMNTVGTRIYVPKGSILKEYSGSGSVTTHEDPELNLTYFYTTLSTSAGDMTEFSLTYEMPFTFSNDIEEYSFQLEKQPGMPNFSFQKELFVDPALTVYRVSPNLKEAGTGYWIFEGDVSAHVDMSALVGN